MLAKTLEMAVYAGEIMLSNGAETYRVEDTMSRILENYHLRHVEILVTPTGILASAEDDARHVVTRLKRIKDRSFHLGKVARVNSLSRLMAEGVMDVSQALEQLQLIDNIPPYRKIIRISACAMACLSFTFMLGGSPAASLVSGFAGFTLYFCIILMSDHRLTSVLLNIIGGAIITFIVLSAINVFHIDITHLGTMIGGGIIPLLPGIGFTNAIRDVLGGDYLSGASRILDAVFVAVSIAAGVGVVMSVWLYIFGGIVL